MNNLDTEKVAEVAEKILSGDMHIVEGCRKVVRLIKDLDQSKQEIFLPFIVFESETECLPLGDLRSKWDAESLVRLEQKMEPYLEEMRAPIYNACRDVVARYGQGSQPSHDAEF